MGGWLTSTVSGSHTALLDGLGLFLLRADLSLGKEKWYLAWLKTQFWGLQVGDILDGPAFPSAHRS